MVIKYFVLIAMFQIRVSIRVAREKTAEMLTRTL